MIVLALEFSTGRRSVAVVSRDGPGAASRLLAQAGDDGSRSVKPLMLVDSVLKQAQLKPMDVEVVAIGLGPGSYNGVRSAIAIAQGWQLASTVKLAGVGSMECLAAQAQAQAEGRVGRNYFVVDAQRNEVYLAVYDFHPGEWRAAEPLKLATIGEVNELVQNFPGPIAGPEATRWFPGASIMVPEAAILARLAVERAEFVAGDALSPIYIRETQFVKAPPPRVLP
jgi:tRNA threonylcarbamoyl adenosine modification protein YeaZ